MAIRRRTRSPATKAAAKKAPKKPGTARKASRKSPAAKAAEDFVRGVLTRGEAARASKKAKLPPGVTHEIVAETGSGLPKLRRRRFSIT